MSVRSTDQSWIRRNQLRYKLHQTEKVRPSKVICCQHAWDFRTLQHFKQLVIKWTMFGQSWLLAWSWYFLVLWWVSGSDMTLYDSVSHLSQGGPCSVSRDSSGHIWSKHCVIQIIVRQTDRDKTISIILGNRNPQWCSHNFLMWDCYCRWSGRKGWMWRWIIYTKSLELSRVVGPPNPRHW